MVNDDYILFLSEKNKRAGRREILNTDMPTYFNEEAVDFALFSI